jgi:glucose/arabinose dehydrogenase
MANNFRRGFDGWFYGGHGVANNTTVRGTDGHSITMKGSTFRFRGDGSRIELFGHGQVNPFGICFDPAGNVYASDCHSAPIYQLLRGAFYPSFGKPDDGLGFGPVMMRHSHGSTAIAGLCYYDDDLWPAEFRGNMFLGNVMTSRVNRDRLSDNGSTRIANEMPDLGLVERPVVSPGRRATRTGWRALHRRFLQSHHRPRRSPVDSSGT